jgi:hypothetical protein
MKAKLFLAREGYICKKVFTGYNTTAGFRLPTTLMAKRKTFKQGESSGVYGI